MVIGTLIAKLGSHYFRPDFGPEQVKHMALDFIEDLGEFAIHEIEAAITAYRREPKNKYFPTPGHLRGWILSERKDRADIEKLGPAIKHHPNRPILWWMQSKSFWKPEWKESDVPMGEMIRDAPGAKLRRPEWA